jgi:hypothetical protein
MERITDGLTTATFGAVAIHITCRRVEQRSASLLVGEHV